MCPRFSKTVSKVNREEWLDFTKDFFIQRDALAHVLLLVDSSVPPQPVSTWFNWDSVARERLAPGSFHCASIMQLLLCPTANVQCYAPRKEWQMLMIASWECIPLPAVNHHTYF